MCDSLPGSDARRKPEAECRMQDAGSKCPTAGEARAWVRGCALCAILSAAHTVMYTPVTVIRKDEDRHRRDNWAGLGKGWKPLPYPSPVNLEEKRVGGVT